MDRFQAKNENDHIWHENGLKGALCKKWAGST